MNGFLPQDSILEAATPEDVDLWRHVQKLARYEWSRCNYANRKLLSHFALPGKLSKELRAAAYNGINIPMYSATGELWALQTLTGNYHHGNPHSKERPLRMLNARQTGLHFWMGDKPADDGRGACIAITEHLHDAVSWNCETGGACLAAFSPLNLAPLVQLVRTAYPAANVVIWARFDEQIQQAREAAESVGARMVQSPDELEATP